MDRNKTYEMLAYRKMKEQVKQGFQEGLGAVVPAGLSLVEIKEIAPGLIEMLRKVCAETIPEIVRDIEKKMSKG